MAISYATAVNNQEDRRDLAAGALCRNRQTVTAFAEIHTYNTGDVTTDAYLDELQQRVRELAVALHNVGIIVGPAPTL